MNHIPLSATFVQSLLDCFFNFFQLIIFYKKVIEHDWNSTINDWSTCSIWSSSFEARSWIIEIDAWLNADQPTSSMNQLWIYFCPTCLIQKLGLRWSDLYTVNFFTWLNPIQETKKNPGDSIISIVKGWLKNLR